MSLYDSLQPGLEGSNYNLYYDTTLVHSEEHGNKLDQTKCLRQSDNNGIFITEKSFPLQRAITHIQNENLKSILLIA